MKTEGINKLAEAVKGMGISMEDATKELIKLAKIMPEIRKIKNPNYRWWHRFEKEYAYIVVPRQVEGIK